MKNAIRSERFEDGFPKRAGIGSVEHRGVKIELVARDEYKETQ